jgi:peroxiredoxin
MDKNKLARLLIPLFLFIFTLAGAGEVFATRERAPDFTLTDLAGKKQRLKDYTGRPVLLIFSTTWCPACVEELPRLKELHRKYAPRGLSMLNINIMESNRKAESFARKHQLPYPTLLDSQGDVANIYRIRGVPSLVLINREGQVICRPCSVIEGHLERLLQK